MAAISKQKTKINNHVTSRSSLMQTLSAHVVQQHLAPRHARARTAIVFTPASPSSSFRKKKKMIKCNADSAGGRSRSKQKRRDPQRGEHHLSSHLTLVSVRTPSYYKGDVEFHSHASRRQSPSSVFRLGWTIVILNAAPRPLLLGQVNQFCEEKKKIIVVVLLC